MRWPGLGPSAPAPRMGMSVSETAIDTRIPTASAVAIAWKNWPTTPSKSTRGMNTTTVVSEEEGDARRERRPHRGEGLRDAVGEVGHLPAVAHEERDDDRVLPVPRHDLRSVLVPGDDARDVAHEDRLPGAGRRREGGHL